MWSGALPQPTLCAGVTMLVTACRHILIQASRAEAADAAPAAPVGSMTIAVHAVGAAVYLIDAHAAADAGSGQDTAGAAEAVPGISIPTGSAAGAAADNSRTATGSVDEAAGAAQAGLLRMLALFLDCGLDMEMKVSRRHGVLSLRVSSCS